MSLMYIVSDIQKSIVCKSVNGSDLAFGFDMIWAPAYPMGLYDFRSSILLDSLKKTFLSTSSFFVFEFCGSSYLTLL